MRRHEALLITASFIVVLCTFVTVSLPSFEGGTPVSNALLTAARGLNTNTKGSGSYDCQDAEVTVGNANYTAASCAALTSDPPAGSSCVNCQYDIASSTSANPNGSNLTYYGTATCSSKRFFGTCGRSISGNIVCDTDPSPTGNCTQTFPQWLPQTQ